MDSQKKYLSQRDQKKKTVVKAIWATIALASVLIIIVIKFALSSTYKVNKQFTGMLTSNDVYAVSKQFIIPTLKGTGAQFSEDGYQYNKKADSVFVIRSVVETKNNEGYPLKTTFKITLKYKGGLILDQKNWDVLNLDED